jgi:membrane protein
MLLILGTFWTLLKNTILGFVADNALSHGAAIAYYAVTSMAPVLVIIVAIAGLVFGEDAARGAVVQQMGGLMGQQSADLLQTAIIAVSDRTAGTIATLIGLGTLIFTASGVFGEMQTALNVIWRAKPRGGTVAQLLRDRVVSLALVAALGFMLMVSLILSAALAAVGQYLDHTPFGSHVIMEAVNFAVSFLFIALMFAALYKALPNAAVLWRDVGVGAVLTLGKSLIGLYVGRSMIASAYGAAGAFIIILLWVYYSAQIFLLGAEFTHAYAEHRSDRGVELQTSGG